MSHHALAHLVQIGVVEYLTVERTYDQVPPFLAGLLNTLGFFMTLSLPMQLDVTEVNGADCASDLLPPGGPWEQRGVTVPECKRGPPAVGTRGTTGDGLSSAARLQSCRVQLWTMCPARPYPSRSYVDTRVCWGAQAQ